VAISKALEAELPDHLILRDQSLFEARLLLKSYDIHFYVLDIKLPDGSGIDLMPDIVNKNPCAGVVVATACPLPQYRAQASEFGILHFMEKPINPRFLGSIAREYLNTYAPTTSDTSFSASLKRLSATDVVQLKCLARANVRLEFALRDHRHGTVLIDDGEIIHAEVAAHPKNPPLQGLDAFRAILSWRGGKVDELPFPEQPRRTLDEGWQRLILTSLQWIDEQRLTKRGDTAKRSRTDKSTATAEEESEASEET